MQQDEHDDLREVLRAEAERHHPDRTAMLNRIAARRATPARGPMARVVAALSRPAAAATAVATLLVVGVAGAQVISSTTSSPPPAAVPATPAPAPVTTSPSAAPSAPPAASRPRTTAPATTPPSTATSKPPPPRPTTTAPRPPGRPVPPAVRNSYLAATAVLDPASFANWAQSNLTLRTTETITELDVTIRIAAAEGTASTGQWSTIPADMITLSVASEEDELVYRFVLVPGRTLAPGDYTFAAQYNHAAGERDVRDDSYKAKADSTADRDAQVSGKFTR